MELGDSASALWQAFASCGRFCGTALIDSVSIEVQIDIGMVEWGIQAW